MWTLFVFVGDAANTRPFDCVMVEGNDVPDTEKRFKQEIKFSHLVFGYRTFSAATKQEAWSRAVDQGVVPKTCIRYEFRNDQHRRMSEEHPTVSHPSHVLNSDPRCKVIPITQITPDNALLCTKCRNWFSWVNPTNDDGSYTCRECRGEVWAP